MLPVTATIARQFWTREATRWRKNGKLGLPFFATRQRIATAAEKSRCCEEVHWVMLRSNTQRNE